MPLAFLLARYTQHNEKKIKTSTNVAIKRYNVTIIRDRVKSVLFGPLVLSLCERQKSVSQQVKTSVQLLRYQHRPFLFHLSASECSLTRLTSTGTAFHLGSCDHSGNRDSHIPSYSLLEVKQIHVIIPEKHSDVILIKVTPNSYDLIIILSTWYLRNAECSSVRLQVVLQYEWKAGEARQVSVNHIIKPRPLCPEHLSTFSLINCRLLNLLIFSVEFKGLRSRLHVSFDGLDVLAQRQ